MRKILASLFVIIAVVGAGVFATGAYFTDTVTQSNLTFQTGTADLKFGFCPGLAADCSGVTAYPGRPGHVPVRDDRPRHHECRLHGLPEHRSICPQPDRWHRYVRPDGPRHELRLPRQGRDRRTSSCQAVGSVVFGMQPLHQAYLASPQSFGSLAPAARIYVIWSNAWDSTGNQNSFQNQTITVNTYMTGQTV